jgi:hypothetical protein
MHALAPNDAKQEAPRCADATRYFPVSSMAFVVASVARQTFILAGFALSVAQSIARGTNRAVVLRHGIADFDVFVMIVDLVSALCLVLITLPLTATVL